MNKTYEKMVETLDSMVREYPVKDILDYMSSVMLQMAEENGHDESERVMRDDAAIVAHAARHVKG